MKVLSSEIIKGGIYARLYIEKEELISAADERKAVEKALLDHASSVGADSLLFVRVTEMEAQDDGGMIMSYDAAIAPKVTLGQYKDLVVKIGHNEDFEEAVLFAAARNLDVEVPEIVIDRKIDNLLLELQANIYDSISLNTLADVYAIIKSLNDDLGIEQSDDEAWQDAMEISENYLSTGVQDIEAFADAIGEICEADSGSITEAVLYRARQRGRLTVQALGEQLFNALLRTEEKTMEQWRQESREMAEMRCRVDFLINAVAEVEDPEISDDEFDTAAAEFAAQYQMTVEDLIAAMTKESILKQLKAIKARQIIIESARDK